MIFFAAAASPILVAFFILSVSSSATLGRGVGVHDVRWVSEALDEMVDVPPPRPARGGVDSFLPTPPRHLLTSVLVAGFRSAAVSADLVTTALSIELTVNSAADSAVGLPDYCTEYGIKTYEAGNTPH
jgi:hypothetical protein